MSEVTGGSTDAGAPAGDTGGSSAGFDWRASLDDTLRADPTLADIKDLNGLAKSYVHAQRMIGKDKVVIPGEAADPTEWEQFYERLGRPADAKYNLDPKGLVPEDLDFKPEVIDHFKKIFHANGLNQKQAEGIFKEYMTYIGEQHNSLKQGSETQRSEWLNEIKKEFGKAYDERIDLAVRAVDTFGGQELKDWLNQTGLGDHPMMIRMFSKIGMQMQESLASPGQTTSFTLTPDTARQEIARMQRDKEFMTAYMTPGSTGHAEAVKKMQDLFSFAYPDEAQV